MASSGGSVVNGPKLTRSNYAEWSIKMKAFLGGLDLGDTIEVEYVEPENIEGANVNVRRAAREAKAREQRALSLIQMCVEDVIFVKIAKCVTAKQAWEALAMAFRGVDRVKKVRLQSLRAEFESVKMRRDERVFDYVARVTDIVNQLSANGEDYDDGRVVEKVLRSLDERYDGLVTAIEQCVDVDGFTLDELIGRLQVFEDKMERRYKGRGLESALASKMRIGDSKRSFERGKASYGFGRGNVNIESEENDENEEEIERDVHEKRFEPQGRGPLRGSFGKGHDRGRLAGIECYKCHERGHIARNCRVGFYREFGAQRRYRSGNVRGAMHRGSYYVDDDVKEGNDIDDVEHVDGKKEEDRKTLMARNDGVYGQDAYDDAFVLSGRNYGIVESKGSSMESDRSVRSARGCDVGSNKVMPLRLKGGYGRRGEAKRRMKCYKCHRIGHIAKFCWGEFNKRQVKRLRDGNMYVKVASYLNVVEPLLKKASKESEVPRVEFCVSGNVKEETSKDEGCVLDDAKKLARKEDVKAQVEIVKIEGLLEGLSDEEMKGIRLQDIKCCATSRVEVECEEALRKNEVKSVVSAKKNSKKGKSSRKKRR